MEAHERSFTFMSTASYYDIPFFQRAYVWDEDNWQELLANFLDQTDSHFLGSIILKQEKLVSGSYPRYMVIDGQQRLTTLSILTRACYDRLIEDKDRYDESVVNGFKTDLHTLLFIKPNRYESREDVKIQHSKLDAPAFQDVIKGKYVDCILEDGKLNPDYRGIDNKIVRCYLFFRKELHDRLTEDVQRIWDLLTEEYPRYLVNIDLDVNENEQKIFDTVNSFGVRLSSSDTIKNAVFQAYIDALRKESAQDIRNRASALYEKTWEKVFEADDEAKKYWETTRRYGRMSRDNLEVFLNSFAVINEFFDPSTDNMVSLPQKYKQVLADMDHNAIEEFLKRIRSFAEIYIEYFSNFDSDSLFTFSDYKTRLLHICHTLDVATFYPYILKLLYLNEVKKELSDSELKDLFLQMERYIILKAVCNGSTKNYNNECVQLIKGRRTPDDLWQASSDISRKAFDDGMIYLRQNKLPTVLLFWVELFNRENQYSDIKYLKYDYTLEHIMPQKWQTNWSIKDVPVIDEDGNQVDDEKEAAERRVAAVYEIGNMTLLNSKLNTAVSNGNFYTKVNGDGKKYKHCMKDLADLYLTREVIKETVWDESKIYQRTDKLQKQIEEIWNISFEEDKPLHFEFDQDNLEKSYYEVFGNRNFYEVADEIDRCDSDDKIKEQLFTFLSDDFLYSKFYGLISYKNSDTILSKDDKDFLRIIGNYGFSEICNILSAVDSRDESAAIKYVVDALKETNTVYKQTIDERAFYYFAIMGVKNRFSDFYETILERIEGLDVTSEVVELCRIMDKYYQSDTPEDKLDVLKPYTAILKNSFVFNALLGEAYFQSSNWNEAIAYLKKYLDAGVYTILPEETVRFWLAWSYEKINNHEESINNYLECINLNPNDGMALNNLGYQYYLTKDYDQALEYYNKCIDVDPNNVYAPNNKAVALIAANKLDELKEYSENPPRILRKAIRDAINKALNGYTE